jgi:hypothetical protein
VTFSGCHFFLGTRISYQDELSSRPKRSGEPALNEVEWGPAVNSSSIRIQMEASPFPLSSREFVTLFSDGQFFLGHSHPVPKYELSSRPKRSEAEGPAVPLTSVGCTWKRHPSLCHPERSRGICSSLHRPPMHRESTTLTSLPPVEIHISIISRSIEAEINPR